MFANDTARLAVNFYNFYGDLIIPQDVKLTIYDTDHAVIETVTSDIMENGRGNFFYDYTAPNHSFIFEFSGIHSTKTVLSRKLVEVKFN